MARTLQQLLAVAVATQTLLITGMNFGLNSVTLIQVPTEEDGFLSMDQLFLTLTITGIGALVGNLLGAPIAPRLGVRRLLLLICPLNAIGSLAVGVGRHFVWTLLGRALVGIALEMAQGTVRGFIAEIAPPNRRATYMGLANVMVFVGQIIALFLGSLLHWQVVFLLAGFVPSAICMCGILLLPGSPKWLLTHAGSELEARKALEFYHGADSGIDDEIKAIQESLKQIITDNDSVSTWRLLGRRETLHPLLLACTQALLFAWGGGATLIVITAIVFEPLDLPLSEYHASVMLVVVAMVSCLLGGPPLERYGRLPLLRLGGIISTIGCGIISAFFLLPADQQEGLDWMVLAGAALSVAATNGIIAAVTFSYINELLPNRTRTLGANLVLATLSIDVTILLQAYPLLRDSIGHGGTFLLHCVVSVLQVVFASCCLHETSGLSLEQIQKLFQTAENIAELTIHVAETKIKPGSDSSIPTGNKSEGASQFLHSDGNTVGNDVTEVTQM